MSSNRGRSVGLVLRSYSGAVRVNVASRGLIMSLMTGSGAGGERAAILNSRS
jgi:hypothetical protein